MDTPIGSFQKSNPEGLLKKTLSILNKKTELDFFEFTKKYSLKFCAIFSRCENLFYISKSIGFDGKSITNSVSTQSFWSGTIDNEGWHFFDKKDFINIASKKIEDSAQDILQELLYKKTK